MGRECDKNGRLILQDENGEVVPKTILDPLGMVGKTIRELDIDCFNVWHIYFTDGTRASIWAGEEWTHGGEIPGLSLGEAE